ncbi:MAG TPA: peptide chain release factor 1 [Treponemataceae bacterium]|mgnify:FL=1|nr:peptide chain release factor 1 [Treponemataceae bacterium]HPA09732.1 peptide chain release factor 1 [Treponemataceae bacterium]
MHDKLQRLRLRFTELETEIQDPDIIRDQKKYRDIMREHAHLSALMDEYSRYCETEKALADTRELIHETDDAEMKAMAKEELHELEQRFEDSEKQLKVLLIPPDPLEEKNIIMEIRGGTGGEEAALFAADLFRMYVRYAEKKNWKYEVLSVNETGLGGFKEISFSISGKYVYGSLRYESGVHRVQRVPETEGSGRIHTSAVTVAVLPEAEETEIDIKQEDLRIDVMRAGGPGGQCVNTTDSAVRLTHLPTGLVVICQDEKSQIKNKAKAMRVLRSRLFDLEEEKKASERAANRKSQVGTGDRSERIRTYNFPQNRVTDHRINLTLYKLDLVMQGEVGELIEALYIAAREEQLSSAHEE